MMKAEVFDIPWMAMDLPFPCEIHTFVARPSITPGAKKILVICTEPRAGMASNEWILENYETFDLIVTYDRSLRHLPNVRLQNFGGAFCDERPARKDFSYSFLFSTGANVAHYHGYQKRRDIARNFGTAAIPGKLFLSSQRLSASDEELAEIHGHAQERNYEVATIGATKLPAMESMFHVAIENHNDDYFFTEKLIDCFRTFTVPIYWGTDKISEYFDMDGVIFLKDTDKFPEVIASLTVEDYWKRMPSIVRNFEISANCMDVVGDVKRHILETLS